MPFFGCLSLFAPPDQINAFESKQSLCYPADICFGFNITTIYCVQTNTAAVNSGLIISFKAFVKLIHHFPRWNEMTYVSTILNIYQRTRQPDFVNHNRILFHVILLISMIIDKLLLNPIQNIIKRHKLGVFSNNSYLLASSTNIILCDLTILIYNNIHILAFPRRSITWRWAAFPYSPFIHVGSL